MALESVKEKSVAYITVYFYDKAGLPATPATAFYQVHDKGSRAVLLARTAFPSLASNVELTMTTTINTLIDNRRKEETRILTVEAAGGGVDVNNEYEYDVMGLEYIL